MCPSDVNEQMNNARPHYAYCGDDVNPAAAAAAADADARPTSRPTTPPVAGRRPVVPPPGTAPRATQQVCLNNSSTRLDETHDERAAAAAVRGDAS